MKPELFYVCTGISFVCLSTIPAAKVHADDGCDHSDENHDAEAPLVITAEPRVQSHRCLFERTQDLGISPRGRRLGRLIFALHLERIFRIRIGIGIHRGWHCNGNANQFFSVFGSTSARLFV